MKKIELAKYWYYKLNDNYSKENFEKRPKFDWQKNELEIFLIDNLIDVHNELEIKDKVLLRLRASSFYGKDFADYIKDLKTGVFKLIWNKEPDGLTWDKYFVKNPTDDKEIDYAAHKRTHPYDSNYFYSIIESVGSEIKEDKIDEITFNNERRSIHLVENKNLEVVDRKISAEVFAKTYTFYYESKGTGTIRTDENQEILDDLERLLKKIEPSLKKEFEKFLLSIGIDFKNEFPFRNMPKLSADKPCIKESKNIGYSVKKSENKSFPKTDLILKNKDGKKDKTKLNNKGGRPADPKIAERNQKIRIEYYRLKSKEHLITKEIIKQLANKFSLAPSTIEKYLK